MYHVNRLIKGKGTNITLKDTAKYPFQKFNVYGNIYQDLTPILPEQYTQLDYIEGTGSQYIDLGYGLGTNSKVEISIDVERSVIDGKGVALFGARTNLTSGNFGIFGNVSWSNNLRWDIANGDIDNKLERGTLRDGNNILIKDGINNYLNGKQLKSNIEVEDFEPEYNSYLLAINTAGGTTSIMPAKIRYFKAWIDETLKYNCLPAKRISDGEIGLYNLVDSTFFTSASSTSFISGNEVTIPNLNDKREIRACGDNINILITENSSNYTINPDGTYNESPSRLCSDFIKVNSNKQDYILSANQSLGFVGIAFYDKDKNYVGRGAKNGVKTLAITKPSNVIYLRVFFQGNLLSSQSWFDYGIKLEKGSTATTYSKPNQGSMTIVKSNKNLADLTKKSTGISACKIQNKNTNSIELISTNTWSNCWFRFEELKDNSDYVISANFLETVAESARVGISVYGNNVPQISGATSIGKHDVKSINKNVKEIRSVSFNTLNYKYVYIRFWNNWSETSVTEGNSLVKVIDIQLEESPIKTDYVEHQSEEYVIPTQQPMYKGDTFVKVGDEWYEKHYFKRYILNGTENINNWYNLDNGGYGFYFYKSDIVSYSNWIMPDLTCNAFKIVSGSDMNNSTFSKPCMSTWEKNIFVKIPIETIGGTSENTKDELSALLKTWLAEQHSNGTPIYIVYPLAEPILIPCTDEQNAILDEIEQEENYKNITHIYSEDEISPIFDLGAFKGITKTFKERLLTGKVTRAYLKVLANETEPEMIINERNYLKDVKFEELRYVPDEGIIGGTVAKRVTGNFNNVDSDFSIQDREFELYMGVDLDDDALNTPSGINVYNKNAKTTNAYIDASGKLISLDNALYTVQEIKPKFKKYIMSYDSLKGAGNVRMSYYNENKFISREYSAVSGKIFTVPDNCNRIDIRVDCSSNIYFIDLMITGGETIPEEYEEFIPNIDYIKLGTYIVKKPENNTVADNTSFEALDYMFKLNLPWDNEITFPCTIKALFDNLVAQSGLKTYVTSFPNQDFVVEANPFDDGVTRREVLSAIAQMAFNWARLDQEDILTMDFEQTDEIQEVFDIDKYSNLDTQDVYGPVNVIVLRNSQVEGENVTIRDEESISKYGETELVIADNPFAFTEAKRAELIEAGRRLFGLTYTPMIMDMIGYLFLNCQDKIKAQALSGKEYETYLFNHTIEYNGTISDSMESPAKTKTVTKYQFTPDLIKQMRRTEIIVDKANENITLISENLSATNDKVAQLRIDKDRIEAEVNNINKEIKDANGNIVALTSTTEKLTETIEGLTNTLTNTGGINLIRNSVGVFDSEYWEGVVKHYTDTEIKNNTTSGHSILLQNGTITQIVNLKNGFYNISFVYKKLKELAECKIKINDFGILLEELELTNYEKVIEVTNNAVKIEIISDTDDSCYVSDLLLISGTSKQEWTQNINETVSDTVKIGKGIEITSTTSRTKLIADSESVRINNTTNNETVAEFTSTGTTTKNLVVEETAQIAGLLIKKNGNQTWISSLL